MISPGSKGWVLKYFNLIEKHKISIDCEKIIAQNSTLKNKAYKHLLFSKTGIIFGYPSESIFAQDLNQEKWTSDEKLSFLLFECHLYIFISNGGKLDDIDAFLLSILDFYENHSVISFSKIFTFFLKESPSEKLEKLLSKRAEIRKNLIDNSFWVNYLSNTFVYLDVILYDEFLKTNKSLFLSNYENYAENALYTIILAAQADGKIEIKEKHLFDVFLASAKIHDKKKDEISELIHADIPLSIIKKSSLKNELFKRFLLDISVLTIFASHDEHPSEELDFLNEFVKHLNLKEENLLETLGVVESFLLKHNQQIPFLSDSNAVEKVYKNFSKRWIKILGRNKDKLANELRQSKELVSLIKKSTTKELTKEEKEKVKSQFMEIAKSMPALAIFILPGGALLLPIVLKIIPDLIPSAFRDNELD
jgi:hypothetical protein